MKKTKVKAATKAATKAAAKAAIKAMIPVRKINQESEDKKMNAENKYPRIGTVNEINHEYTQHMTARSTFSVTRQMQQDKDKGINYPDKYAYPITVEDLCIAWKNCYCRYLIRELILRGYNATMGQYMSPDYWEYHVIAKERENRYCCIVTNAEAHDYMCWVEMVDMETLETYTSWRPFSLMELAERLQIMIGM